MAIYQPVAYVGNAALQSELLRIAAVINSLAANKLEVATEAPARPFHGMVLLSDGVNWNPIGLGVEKPVWFDGLIWRAF